MLRRSKTKALKDDVVSGRDLAVALSRDKTFRKHLLAALAHGAAARRRAGRRMALAAIVARLAVDEQLRRELATMAKDLQQAWGRVEKKRSHRLRTTLLVLGGGAAVAGLVGSRGRLQKRVTELRRDDRDGARTTDEAVEVGVPVATETRA